MAKVNMERASSYLRLIESQKYTLQVQRIACWAVIASSAGYDL